MSEEVKNDRLIEPYGGTLVNLLVSPEERQGRPKVGHPGTYNANPLSSAAGIACLKLVADPAIQERATASFRIDTSVRGRMSKLSANKVTA